MRSRKDRIVAVGILLVIMTMFMAACGCNHEWQDATCLAPKTCVRCGKTEGKIRSHDWGSTACDSPEPCTVCGTMEGMELTHNWRTDCRICISCGRDERPADDRFPDAVTRGLENRWALAAATETKNEKDFTKEDWEKMFDAEYQQVIEFKDETFKERELAEYAVRYVNSITDSIESLKYFDTEQWEDRYFNTAYQEQSLVLYHINQICPISVSDEYQEEFQEFLENGEMVDKIYSLLDQVLFLQIESSKEEKIYETTVRNTTEMDFEFFSFEVNLLDEEGEIIETKVTTAEPWKSGEKVRFRFTTTEDFHAIDVKYVNWIFL